MSDPVTNPAHYTFGKYEVLDVILDWDLNFTRGSAVKYIARAGRKSKDAEAQDLRKAAQVLLREADMLEDKNG